MERRRDDVEPTVFEATGHGAGGAMRGRPETFFFLAEYLRLASGQFHKYWCSDIKLRMPQNV